MKQWSEVQYITSAFLQIMEWLYLSFESWDCWQSNTFWHKLEYEKNDPKHARAYYYCTRPILVRQRLAWRPSTQATVVASPQLLSRLQSSSCTHRVPEVATGMSASPTATLITARRLSEPFGHPVRLTRCGCRRTSSCSIQIASIGVWRVSRLQALSLCVWVSECEWFTSHCISSTCGLLNESYIQSVQRFEPVGVPNRFTTVEKIIIKCLMVIARPGGTCTRVRHVCEHCVCVWARMKGLSASWSLW